MSRNRLIARLHALKREQGLDDELYRDKLEQLTGKRSAADLSDAELQRAVGRFGGNSAGQQPTRLPSTPACRLIQAQWISLYNLGIVHDASDAAILAFIKRQTRLDAAQWLNDHDHIKAVVEALKDWLARDGGVDWRNQPGMPANLQGPVFKVCLAQWRRLDELAEVYRGKTWTGNARPLLEGLLNYAKAFERELEPLTGWDNPQWAKVSKALGRKLRAAQKAKREAA